MTEQLEKTANAMVSEGRGILAADESNATIKKRFDSINVESTENNRRDYREMLFRAEDGMKNHISGVILFEETLKQFARDETRLVDLITKSGAIPGIKVDKGAKKLAGSQNEKITEGLDGLRERLAEYYDLGARFAKWRAVIDVANDIPTSNCVQANAHALARYAALCQEAGIVPIVEPEVQMDGEKSVHTIDECYEISVSVFSVVFNELHLADVLLEGIVLKPNMVIAGKNCSDQASAEEVAELTVRCLKNTVPAAVPGIAFLSGGQSDIQATEHLSLMNCMGKLPWNLTFSYGRALQQSALNAWQGKDDNWDAAQKAFSHRARMNSLASLGKWSADEENN